MKLILIAAMTADRVIGRDGRLPWHLPEDLRFFRRQTTGHAVIMGRKTFDSIGRPLPKRRNVVVTRNPAFSPRGLSDPPAAEDAVFAAEGPSNETTRLDVAHSLDAAIDLCRGRGESKAFVIGGAEIYAQALPIADEMIITHVAGQYDGDARFPEWTESEWSRIGSIDRSYPTATLYRRARTPKWT